MLIFIPPWISSSTNVRITVLSSEIFATGPPVGKEILGRGFHNFQRLRGLRDQGAELDILRH
jgi:hypothetical protein